MGFGLVGAESIKPDSSKRPEGMSNGRIGKRLMSGIVARHSGPTLR